MVNIIDKGKSAEREVATKLNDIVNRVLLRNGLALPAVPVVQRNQNQSAVGGNDLKGTFGLAIEVKRQETLSINAWWKQCCAAAERNQEVPVLVYRQSRKPWHVITNGWLMLPGGAMSMVRCEMGWPDFEQWFERWVEAKVRAGEVPHV